jgi:hypothetical protein
MLCEIVLQILHIYLRIRLEGYTARRFKLSFVRLI